MDLKNTANLMQGKYGYIFDHIGACSSAIINKVKTIDIKSLVTSLTLVAAIYMAMFYYIKSNDSASIMKIESMLDTKTVAVTAGNISDYSAPTPNSHDMSIEEMHSFYENDTLGLLPIIRPSDNKGSFEAFRVNLPLGDTTKPLISFVIIDYGLSKEQSKLALDLLPSGVTFSLSPYSSLPNEWVKMAKNKGHEVWLDLPIQKDSGIDTGENTIFHHAPLVKKEKAMRLSLAKAQGYAGVTSFTDSSINKSKGHYFKLVNEIYSRGLAFLEFNPKADGAIKQRSLYMNKPYINADTKIIMTRGKFAFNELEELAKKRGYAIAVIPNYPETIKNLAVWIMKVGQIDYSIVPASAVYDAQAKAHHAEGKDTLPLKANDHVEPEETQPQRQTSNH